MGEEKKEADEKTQVDSSVVGMLLPREFALDTGELNWPRHLLVCFIAKPFKLRGLRYLPIQQQKTKTDYGNTLN